MTWQDLVLADLRDARADIKEMRSDLSSLRTDIVALKTRASIWGFMAGAIPGIVAIVVTIIAKWG